MLKPEVDLRRTVGWFTTVYPVALDCATGRGAAPGNCFDEVQPHAESRSALRNRIRAAAVPVRTDRAAARRAAPADIFFSYRRARSRSCRPCRPMRSVQFDADTAMPVREAIPGLGHAVELRVYRMRRRARIWIGGTTPAGSGGDGARRFAERFPATLIGSDQGSDQPKTKATADSDELALVDLSSADIDIGEAMPAPIKRWSSTGSERSFGSVVALRDISFRSAAARCSGCWAQRCRQDDDGRHPVDADRGRIAATRGGRA